MVEELVETKVVWLLTFCDGFSNAWSVFYAPSQEKAERQAREWIEQLTYNVTDIKLTAYPRCSSILYLCTFWNDGVKRPVVEHFQAQKASKSSA